MDENTYLIREMKMDDFEGVHALWRTIHGFAIRSIDDSREGIERFLRRNPTTCIVAEAAGRIVGTILCGHDGRSGCFYHVCVNEAHRKKGIGGAMVRAALESLKKEHINKVFLIAFTRNELGNHFWNSMGWKLRDDLNYYEFTINEENTTEFIP